MSSAPWAIPLVLLTLACTGCLPAGTRILHLDVDPALSAAQLDRDRVAIVPAQASTPMLRQTNLAPVDALLVHTIEERRPSVSLVSPERVRSVLHHRQHLDRAVARYAQTLEIPSAELSELAGAVDARYVAFTVLDEYSFGWGDVDEPHYRKLTHKEEMARGLGVFGAGILFGFVGATATSLATRNDPDRAVTLTGRAHTRVAGSLCMFDVREGTTVWVGAAMVTDEVERSRRVPIRQTHHQTPIVRPRPMLALLPRMFEALVDRWPS